MHIITCLVLSSALFAWVTDSRPNPVASVIGLDTRNNIQPSASSISNRIVIHSQDNGWERSPSQHPEARILSGLNQLTISQESQEQRPKDSFNKDEVKQRKADSIGTENKTRPPPPINARENPVLIRGDDASLPELTTRNGKDGENNKILIAYSVPDSSADHPTSNTTFIIAATQTKSELDEHIKLEEPDTGLVAPADDHDIEDVAVINFKASPFLLSPAISPELAPKVFSRPLSLIDELGPLF